MNSYIFILGSFPALSVKEIINYLNYHQIKTDKLVIKNQFLMILTKENLDCQVLGKELAGTIKIAQVIKEDNINSFFKSEKENLKNIDGKIKIGFSLYSDKNIKQGQLVKRYKETEKVFFKTEKRIKRNRQKCSFSYQ